MRRQSTIANDLTMCFIFGMSDHDDGLDRSAVFDVCITADQRDAWLAGFEHARVESLLECDGGFTSVGVRQ